MKTSKQSRRKTTPSAAALFDLPMPSGALLRVQFITPAVVRVRLSADGSFPETPLERYGFITEPAVRTAVKQSGNRDAVALSSDALSVQVNRKTGVVRFLDAQGNPLLQEARRAELGPDGGYRLAFKCRRDEKFYGLGDAIRKSVNRRGQRVDMWVQNVLSYIPIPFFMSTRGYGLFVNTTYRHVFDMAASAPDRITIESNRALLDYYFILGPSRPAMLDAYSQLTGRPPMPPKWSFGLWFICPSHERDHDVLDNCHNFRKEGIPCDVIGLEPGWMETVYDYTTEKKWHPERFPIPKWTCGGPNNFVSVMKRMGFKFELWLCCDYDLSYEAERRAGRATPAVKQVAQQFHKEDVVKDVHFIFPVKQDKITKPDEPWFEHLKKFVDLGTDFFKQDASLEVMEHPDKRWGNGMDDAQMHNLYPLLYAQEMYEGFKGHTGRRPLPFKAVGWAGIQRYSGTWAGDTGGGAPTVVASINLGLCAHSYTTCDMAVAAPESIHYGFLMPWAHVNSFGDWRHPWLLGERLKAVFTDYARLRYRLLPYLYSCASQSHETGMPIMRAMNLEFPDDEDAADLTAQYMLGPAFLVGAFTGKVYLPAGTWTDYWTGQSFEGPRTIAYSPPADRGGALFVRAGSIIPEALPMDYVGHHDFQTVVLEVFPGPETEFTLYEDDGVSFDHLKGVFAKTPLAAEQTPDSVIVRASARDGSYSGMPAKRDYELRVHCPRPGRVLVDGKTIPMRPGAPHAPVAWSYEEAARILTIAAIPGAARGFECRILKS